MSRKHAISIDKIEEILDSQIQQVHDQVDALLLQVVERGVINDLIYRGSVERQVLLRIKTILKMETIGEENGKQQ